MYQVIRSFLTALVESDTGKHIGTTSFVWKNDAQIIYVFERDVRLYDLERDINPYQVDVFTHVSLDIRIWNDLIRYHLAWNSHRNILAVGEDNSVYLYDELEDPINEPYHAGYSSGMRPKLATISLPDVSLRGINWQDRDTLSIAVDYQNYQYSLPSRKLTPSHDPISEEAMPKKIADLVIGKVITWDIHTTRQHLACGTDHGEVAFFDLTTGQAIGKLSAIDDEIVHLKFSPNGDTLAFELGSGSIHIVKYV